MAILNPWIYFLHFRMLDCGMLASAVQLYMTAMGWFVFGFAGQRQMARFDWDFKSDRWRTGVLFWQALGSVFGFLLGGFFADQLMVGVCKIYVLRYDSIFYALGPVFCLKK